MKKVLYLGKVGSGKTTTAIEIAVDNIKIGARVLYVTQEMTPDFVIEEVRKKIMYYIFSGHLGRFEYASGHDIKRNDFRGCNFDIVIYDCVGNLEKKVMPNKGGILYVFEQLNYRGYDDIKIIK